MKAIVIGGEYLLVRMRKLKLNGRKVTVIGREADSYVADLVDARPGDKRRVIVEAHNLMVDDTKAAPTDSSTDGKREPTPKIIERLKKLLAMAERTEGNEHEASVAAAMAAKLMAQYNVDNAQLVMDDLAAGGRLCAKVAEPLDDWTGERYPGWLATLAPAIANLFDCKAAKMRTGRFNRERREHYYSVGFLGYELDVEVAVWTFETIARDISRMANKAWDKDKDFMLELFEQAKRQAKEDGDEQPAGVSAKGFKTSHRLAAAGVVIDRIKQMLAEKRKGEAGSIIGTALITAKDAAIEAEFGKLDYAKKTIDPASIFGASAGAKDGEKININTPIGNKAETDTRRLLK